MSSYSVVSRTSVSFFLFLWRGPGGGPLRDTTKDMGCALTFTGKEHVSAVKHLRFMYYMHHPGTR